MVNNLFEKCTCKNCEWFGINNVCNNYYSEYCGLEVFSYMHKCTAICVMCLNTKNTKKDSRKDCTLQDYNNFILEIAQQVGNDD